MFLGKIQTFQDFILKGINQLIPSVAAGLTSLSLPPFVSLSLALLTVNRLVPTARQTWGGRVAWLPGRDK